MRPGAPGLRSAGPADGQAMSGLFPSAVEKAALVGLIDDLGATTQPGASFAIFSRAIETIGFNGAMLVARDTSAMWREGITETNYPSAWVSRYVSQNYTRTDPTRRFCFRTGEAFFWSDTFRYYRKKDLRIFDEAKEFGLRSGMILPIHTGGMLVGALGVSSGAQKLDDPRLKPFIRLAAAIFYVAYLQRRSGQVEAPVHSPGLTKREVEVLALISEGCSNLDISRILSIKLVSAEFHIGNILRKLEVDNRVSAVVRAIRLGLIEV
jgi:DNA-binding CsgD family transcriptional regulator